MTLKVSPTAHDRLSTLQKKVENKKKSFRVRVDTGGCFGFQYNFSFDIQRDGDLIIELGSLKILVDDITLPFIESAELDYQEEMIGAQFVINNPKAENSCGCKNSFSFNL